MSIPDQRRRRRLEPAGPLPDAPAVPARDEPYAPALGPPEDFRVDVLSSDGVHRLVLRGELDLVGAPLLSARVREACTGPTRALHLDMRRLGFMDSSGLHVVLDARALCLREGFGFAVIAPTQAVRRVFQVSGLDTLLGV